LNIPTIETTFDACSLINLVNGEVLDRVLTLPQRSWFVGNIVLDECAPLPELDEAILKGSIISLDDADIDADDFLNLLDLYNLGDGETECIAYAIKFGYVVSTDDRKTRGVIERDLGKHQRIGSIGLLTESVAAAIITPDEAKAAYKRMLTAGAFLPVLKDDYFVV
jgi:predicted nucleic acid-binding protein